MNKKSKKKQSKQIKTKKQKTVNKWYHNNLFVLLMLITVFPLGLFLVLTNERLKKELLPTAKVIGVVAILLISYQLFTSDNTKPKLEMKPEMTYNVNSDLSPKKLITDYYVSVSDNDTKLTKEDIIIKNYKKLDFSKKGTQTINFIVKDKDMNFRNYESKIIIK